VVIWQTGKKYNISWIIDLMGLHRFAESNHQLHGKDLWRTVVIIALTFRLQSILFSCETNPDICYLFSAHARPIQILARWRSLPLDQTPFFQWSWGPRKMPLYNFKNRTSDYILSLFRNIQSPYYGNSSFSLVWLHKYLLHLGVYGCLHNWWGP